MHMEVLLYADSTERGCRITDNKEHGDENRGVDEALLFSVEKTSAPTGTRGSACGAPHLGFQDTVPGSLFGYMPFLLGVRMLHVLSIPQGFFNCAAVLCDPPVDHAHHQGENRYQANISPEARRRGPAGTSSRRAPRLRKVTADLGPKPFCLIGLTPRYL